MATKHTDECLRKAAPDEPIFVLRAQDALAPGLVREWADRAVEAGVTSPKITEARELADRMDVWQQTRIRKIPD